MSGLFQIVLDRPLVSLAVIVVLLLLLAWLIYRLIRRGETRGAIEPSDLEVCGEAPAEIIAFTSDPLRGDVRRSFARAESSLRRMLPGRLRRYARPWVLAMGPADGGKTTLLSRSGMALPYGGPVPDSPGINWWAFDGGIVLDIAGRSCLQSDACASDDEEWRGLLRKIRKSRRRRPIDAVVLALPVSELMPSGRNDDQRLARAASRAGYLHRKLAEAQRALQMRFPIYLVVSHCDRLPGFSSLRGSLAATERQQIVGWSNPGPVNSRYSAAVVDRAFDDIEAQLEEFQLELLAGAAAGAGDDELIALPERLRSLAEPLRIFANHIFLPKADCEEPLFRGIYFCGGATAAEPTGSSLVTTDRAARPPGEVVFVGDLLQQKVFPEAALARPTELADRRARRRKVLVGLLIAGLLAWGAAGLIVGQDRLAARLGPAGSSTDAGLTTFLDRFGDTGGGAPGSSPEAGDLLRQISQVESFRVWSPLLPASWFGGLQGDVDRSVGESFERIVLPALLAELEERSDSLLAQPIPELDPSTVAIEPVEAYPQFQRLESYVGQLTGLAQLIDRYQAFTPAGDDRRASLKEFNDLSVELLGEELRPKTRKAERYLRRRLEALSAQPFDYAARQQGTRKAILDRTDQLYKALFVHHRLLQDLEDVSVSLASLGPMQWSTEADEGTFQQLYRGLDRVGRDLEEPDLAWASAAELNLGPRFDEIRRQVHESSFLGPDLGPRVSEEMRRRAQEMFSRLKKALLVFGTSYGGPLLELRDGKYVLTESAGDLTASLGLLVGELFMQPQPEAELVAQAPPGKMLLWKKQPLEEALAVFDSFEAFPGNLQKFLDERKLDDLPPPLRQSVPQIAAAAAGSHLIGLVANAISFEPLPPGLSLEEAVEMQVRNLQEVEPIHSQILGALDAMDRAADSLRLGGILRRYQVGILQQVDQILSADPLYQPRFDAWQGDGTPAVPGFVETVDDIGKYLDAQREIADRLTSAYARPVLAAYGAAGHRRLLATSGTARWWMRMIDDLEAYGSKEPGNPIGTLESFVAATLPEVDLYNCFGPLPPPEATDAPPPAGASTPPTRPQGDFFLDRLTELRVSLGRRCTELADEVGFVRYRKLAAEFNRLLAGRFPFAPASAAAAADPADIKSLLGWTDPLTGPDHQHEFGHAITGPVQRDEFRHTLILIRNLPDESRRRQQPRRWKFADSTAEVQRFMELLEVVRVFFAPYLPEEAELEVPTFDLEVEFRTLRSKELGANQIVRWELEVGEEQRLDLLASLRAARTPPVPDAEPPARWAYGLASVLSVAWASESPFAPLTVEPSARAAIDGRQVTFAYREPWSLLRLVAELEAGADELPELTDQPRPEILGIAVRTASADEPHPVGLARLYLTLSLLQPGDDTPLEYPDFPHKAPVPLMPAPGASAPSP